MLTLQVIVIVQSLGVFICHSAQVRHRVLGKALNRFILFKLKADLVAARSHLHAANVGHSVVKTTHLLLLDIVRLVGLLCRAHASDLVAAQVW